MCFPSSTLRGILLRSPIEANIDSNNAIHHNKFFVRYLMGTQVRSQSRRMCWVSGMLLHARETRSKPLSRAYSNHFPVGDRPCEEANASADAPAVGAQVTKPCFLCACAVRHISPRLCLSSELYRLQLRRKRMDSCLERRYAQIKSRVCTISQYRVIGGVTTSVLRTRTRQNTVRRAGRDGVSRRKTILAW